MYFGMSGKAQQGLFERSAAGFFILVTIAFTPPFTVVTVWQDERKLVRKEVTQNVYSLDTFFWSKTMTLLPVELFFSLLVRPCNRCTLCITKRARSGQAVRQASILSLKRLDLLEQYTVSAHVCRHGRVEPELCICQWMAPTTAQHLFHLFCTRPSQRSLSAHHLETVEH